MEEQKVLKRFRTVRRKRHESDIVILPPVRIVPLKYEPEAGSKLWQDGDMGIRRFWIARVAYRKRRIKTIVNRLLKVFEKTNGQVTIVGGPCEI